MLAVLCGRAGGREGGKGRQDPVLAVHGSLSATMEEMIAHRWVASEECGYAVYSLMIAVGKHFVLVD